MIALRGHAATVTSENHRCWCPDRERDRFVCRWCLRVASGGNRAWSGTVYGVPRVSSQEGVERELGLACARSEIS